MLCNGAEIAGESIRIHKEKFILEKGLGYFRKEVDIKFDHLLRAFSVGCRLHGGIAFGLDRILLLMCNGSRLSDVIAFPKSTQGTDLMTNSPSLFQSDTLIEYNLKQI